MKHSIFTLLGFIGLTVSSSAAPNVLFIALDDLRPELGSYGETHMQTPHIDALANSGRVFRNHYVSVPTCGASRYALMTSLRPTAASDGNNAFNAMPTTETAAPESWVHLLRQNGWYTASMGKVTHEPDGFRWSFPNNFDDGRFRGNNAEMRFSFDEIIYDHSSWGARRYPLFAYADGTGRVRRNTPAFEIGVDADGNSLPDDAYPDGQLALAAIEKLREFKQDGTQFCLTLGFFKPHLPFNAPKAYFDLYDPAALPAPDPVSAPTGANSSTGNSGEPNSYTQNSDRAQLRYAYVACISYVDAQVGKVLDELEALGMADNTIVVLWGDHGWCFDDYGRIGKHSVLERAVQSPLIIRAPDNSANPEAFRGLGTKGIVSSIDIYPTIAELCGLSSQIPSSVDGESLVPMLQNPFSPGKSQAFSRFGDVTSIRTDTHRLIRSGGGANDLYDLTAHPYELADVSASNGPLTTQLENRLTVRGTRPGNTYEDWALNVPELADPLTDADSDGSSNLLEYLAGTDPTNDQSLVNTELSFEDLGAGSEPVFTYQLSNIANDASLIPTSSTDLSQWFSSSLRFYEANPISGSTNTELRFRVATPSAAPLGLRRFFRVEASDN